MQMGHYIENSFIVDVKSTTFRGALEELLECCPLNKIQKRSELLDDLITREGTVSSYLGQGICLPHIKVRMRKSYLFALGRIRKPLQDASVHDSDKIRLIILLLVSEKVDNCVTMLSSLAKIFQTIKLSNDLTQLPLEEFRAKVLQAFKTIPTKQATRTNSFNRLMLRESIKIAKAGNCSSVFLFQDTFLNQTQEINTLDTDLKTIIISQRAPEISQKGNTYTLPIQLFANSRLAQLRSAILLALIHKCIKYNEKICCIGGLPHSNRIDTVVITEANREIQSVFSQQTDILPPSVLPEVFERLLTIATQLAVEGREGKSVGCLFVLGDVKALEPYMHPLILNPFYGYSSEDRNLLNPFIDETIKEYSLLDGAFVISGDGVVESAGTLIHTSDQISLPGGLGTRHAAAVAISKAVDCIAITISSSTNQVSLFRNGKMLPLFDKGLE